MSAIGPRAGSRRRGLSWRSSGHYAFLPRSRARLSPSIIARSSVGYGAGDLRAFEIEVRARPVGPHHDLLGPQALCRRCARPGAVPPRSPGTGSACGRPRGSPPSDSRSCPCGRRGQGRLGTADDLLDRERRAERIVQRVDEYDLAVVRTRLQHRVEQPVIAEVIPVHRRMQLDPAQPGFGAARDHRGRVRKRGLT